MKVLNSLDVYVLSVERATFYGLYSLADDCNKIRFIVDCHYTSRSQRNIFKLT